MSENGSIITNEDSGHFGRNWTNETRAIFQKFMEATLDKNKNHQHEVWKP